MRRHIPGLHSRQQDLASNLDGFFLVRVERASYRWHPQKPFLGLRFGILEPSSFEGVSFSGRLYSTERALWKLNWFLRDFGYDIELFSRDQIDEKALLNLRGVIRTTFTNLNGRSYQNLDAFAPAAEWEAISHTSSNQERNQGQPRCPIATLRFPITFAARAVIVIGTWTTGVRKRQGRQ